MYALSCQPYSEKSMLLLIPDGTANKAVNLWVDQYKVCFLLAIGQDHYKVTSDSKIDLR